MPKKIIAGAIIAGATVGGGAATANDLINPYTQVGNAYVLPIADTLNSNASSSVAIAASAPDVTLSKWGGLEQMTVAYEAPAPTSDASRPFLSHSLDYSDTDNQSIIVNPVDATTSMEDGGIEVDIGLASEPDTNVFNFDISGSGDMDFYYQPPLSQDDPQPDWTCTDTQCEDAQGNVVQERPENIVGSYAVYSTDHRNDVEGQTNYATGKLFQIFRPLVTDSMGSTTWASLLYQNGVLSVTVPQNFLDSASYPVVVDPTFGYTSQGASSQAEDSDGDGWGQTGTGVTGTLTSISAYLRGSTSGTLDGDFWNFYNNCATSCTAIVSSNENDTVTSSFTLITHSLSGTLSGNPQYVVINLESYPTNSYIAYDSGTAVNGGTVSASDNAWTAIPTQNFSVYATYTASPTNTFAPWQFSDF